MFQDSPEVIWEWEATLVQPLRVTLSMKTKLPTQVVTNQNMVWRKRLGVFQAKECLRKLQASEIIKWNGRRYLICYAKVFTQLEFGFSRLYLHVRIQQINLIGRWEH